ncbi:MAG TPA: ChbG/HpnK family deacetylase [Terracidiphilus sp.]|nr:ChbG/HpnK family deacetylase [Terracidiphilus sp.]
MRRLIVNADDFGLTSGVNRAIVELHAAGVLTSATLMAKAEATGEAIVLALGTPSLAVGCHVVLVDGEPVLPPRELPSLTDSRTGRFHPTLGGFLRRLLSGAIRAEEIEAEARAQIEKLAGRIALTHVDTHKHTYMFKRVLRPVLRAARAAGISAVRNPFEPRWSRRATRDAPGMRRMEVSLLSRLESSFRQIVTAEGFATTDGAMGVLATGTLDAATVTALLSTMPEGTFELVAHPGYNDAALARAHTRLLASREAERTALMAVRPFTAATLGSFADLRSPARQTSTK